MTNQEAIETIKANYPPENYSMLREALDIALTLLEDQEAKPMIENERGWNCPSCGIKLIGKTASGYPCDLIDLPLNFCPRCGQEMSRNEQI